MKLASNLIHHRHLLWVKVLRSKYGCGMDLLPTIKKPQVCSNVWNDISKIWPLFQQNLVWRLGMGTNVHFWTDHWIPGIHRLADFVSQGSDCINLQETVASFVNGNSWYYPHILNLLSEDWMSIFATIKSLELSLGEDCVAWLHSPNG
ncbi:hypothetical protein PIB30_067257 [Stylosanthes scabra]|uniref:Reverse transcriptase zinc-binding domain-containing protein n=1 Tax=Stylosanthes scabra TaxID=79078 RepID=A0ABU6TMA1_9FABA|nr:hypothetical protein [Stylosanthes scabra]